MSGELSLGTNGGRARFAVGHGEAVKKVNSVFGLRKMKAVLRGGGFKSKEVGEGAEVIEFKLFA